MVKVEWMFCVKMILYVLVLLEKFRGRHRHIKAIVDILNGIRDGKHHQIIKNL